VNELKKARWDGKKSKWREIKHNYKLQEERYSDSTINSMFSVGARTKPTRHVQCCALCHNQFEKGEKQIVTDSGFRVIYQSSNVRTFHTSVKSSNARERSIIQPRRVYAHPSCFVCFLNYVGKKSGISELLTVGGICDSCKNRFRCYTEIPENAWQRIKVMEEKDGNSSSG
jgi:hypothetical protein